MSEALDSTHALDARPLIKPLIPPSRLPTGSTASDCFKQEASRGPMGTRPALATTRRLAHRKPTDQSASVARLTRRRLAAVHRDAIVTQLALIYGRVGRSQRVRRGKRVNDEHKEISERVSTQDGVCCDSLHSYICRRLFSERIGLNDSCCAF